MPWPPLSGSYMAQVLGTTSGGSSPELPTWSDKVLSALPETLQGIQVLGPTLIQTFQKLTLTLNFLGR